MIRTLNQIDQLENTYTIFLKMVINVNDVKKFSLLFVKRCNVSRPISTDYPDPPLDQF